MYCKYCGKDFQKSNGLLQHEIRCKLNPERIKIRDLSKENNPMFNKKGSNQYIYAKDHNLDKPSVSEENRKKVSLRFKGKKLKRETIEKMRKKGGGLRHGAGRGKKGWYKGIYCDSLWELAYTIFCFDHGFKIERNKKYFEYSYKGKIYKYYPDFIVDGEYTEIKGYKSDRWKEKERQFTERLNIYDNILIQPILEYVKNKYGEDFIRMYDIK